MSTHGIIQPIRFTTVSLIIVLFGLSTGTALADRSDRGRDSRGPSKSQVTKQDNKTDDSRTNTRYSLPARQTIQRNDPAPRLTMPRGQDGKPDNKTGPQFSFPVRQSPPHGTVIATQPTGPASSGPHCIGPKDSNSKPNFGPRGTYTAPQPSNDRPAQAPNLSRPDDDRQAKIEAERNRRREVEADRHSPAIRPPRNVGAFHRPVVKPAYRPAAYRPPVYRSGFYYYPTHFQNRPLRFGFWYFGGYDPLFCRRSIYFYFGYFPYVQVTRVWVGSYVSVTYYTTPVVIHNSYYLAREATSGLDSALADIRGAWLNGRFDLIQNHVHSDDKIAVLLDGEYDYSLDTDDYLQMTADAVDQVKTIGFTWQSIRQRTDGAYTAYGKHTYSDSTGATKTIYVSYTLQNIGGGYYIEEVGSSESSLI